MSYRYKLLLLFLAISVVPVIGMRTFGITQVKQMGDELVRAVRTERMGHMAERFESAVAVAAANLEREVRQVDSAASFLAREMSGAMLRRECGCGESACVVYAYGAADECPRLAACRKPPQGTELASAGFDGVSPDKGGCEVACRLASASRAFETVSSLLGDVVIRQRVVVRAGKQGLATATYPGEPGRVDPGRGLPFGTSERAMNIGWNGPLAAPLTGQPVLVRNAAVFGADGRAGRVELEVPLARLIAGATLHPGMSAGVRLLAASWSETDPGGKVWLRPWAEYGEQDGAPWWRLYPLSERIEVEGQGTWKTIFKMVENGDTGFHPATFDGRTSVVAYTPLPVDKCAVFMIAPAGRTDSGTVPAAEKVREQIGRIDHVTMVMLFTLVVGVIILALFFSRTVTRPVRKMVKAANELAGGNFDVRVDIQRKDEFGEMARVFNTMGPQLEAHYEVRQSLAVATEVQQSLLPAEPPRIDGVDLAGRAVYSEGTGGDYFDYLCVGPPVDRTICVVVGDVAGHGLPSALTMATARAFFRLRVTEAEPLPDIMEDVNRALYPDVESGGGFMTLFLARLDMNRHTVKWVRAGHEPALLYNTDTDRFTLLEGDGLPLGVFEDTVYVDNEHRLKKGDILVIGTDGLWESIRPDGQRFGKKRFREAVRNHAGLDATGLVNALLRDVREFCAPRIPEDDLTLVVAKMVE